MDVLEEGAGGDGYGREVSRLGRKTKNEKQTCVQSCMTSTRQHYSSSIGKKNEGNIIHDMIHDVINEMVRENRGGGASVAMVSHIFFEC